MRLPANPLVYTNMSVSLNKSVLNWTQECQLHRKTQLHEKTLYLTLKYKTSKKTLSVRNTLAYFPPESVTNYGESLIRLTPGSTTPRWGPTSPASRY